MKFSAAGIALLATLAFGIPSSAAVYVFEVNLRPGVTHPDVIELQRYLNGQGIPVAPAGPGSPGNETSYFGGLTKAALIAFQEKHADAILRPSGLTAGTGNFFSATRAFVNAVKETAGPADGVPLTPAPKRRGGSGSRSAPTAFTVGGTLSGLSGTIVLRNNGADDLALTSNGQFSFGQMLASSAAYLVSVFSQPVNQLCDTSGSAGTVQGANVNSVRVDCYSFPSISFPNYVGYFASPEFVSPEGDIVLAPTSNSSGSFTYVSSNPVVATIIGNTLELNGYGTTTVTAYQATSSPYAARSISAVFQINLDACRSEPCLNDGVCTNVPPSDFSCACQGGYSGTLCDESTTACQGLCVNSGVCRPDSSGGYCDCPTGWTGQYCQTLSLSEA